MTMEKLKNKKLFLLDMDGTIYLGDKLFDGALQFLQKIKENGGRYAFMTNNSSKSRFAYIEKLKKLGIEAEEDDFITSVNATCDYLLENYKGKKIYVMGTRSFVEELLTSGIDAVTELVPGIDCFVIGYDTELTYKKLEDACYLLRNGVDFIATNPDWVCPTADGYLPDCGAMCQMLNHATGRTPKVIGKPQPDMALTALRKYGYEKTDAVVIGDRLYTDIACGINAGIDTVFVLSGEGTVEDIEKMNIHPTCTVEGVWEIYKSIL